MWALSVRGRALGVERLERWELEAGFLSGLFSIQKAGWRGKKQEG